MSTTLPPCAPAPGGRNPLLGNPAPHSPCPSPGQARGLGHICPHPQGPHHGPVPPRRPHECTRPLGCSLPLPTLRTAGLCPACPLSTHREGEGPAGEKADVRPPRVLRSSLARPEPGWGGHGGQVPKGPLSTRVLVACAATLLSNPLLGNQGAAGRSPPPSIHTQFSEFQECPLGSPAAPQSLGVNSHCARTRCGGPRGPPPGSLHAPTPALEEPPAYPPHLCRRSRLYS